MSIVIATDALDFEKALLLRCFIFIKASRHLVVFPSVTVPLTRSQHCFTASSRSATTKRWTRSASTFRPQNPIGISLTATKAISPVTTNNTPNRATTSRLTKRLQRPQCRTQSPTSSRPSQSRSSVLTVSPSSEGTVSYKRSNNPV